MNIALFSGSFNPPGIHHIKIVKKLTTEFDKVFITPCGERIGKEYCKTTHRKTMIKMSFENIKGAEIDFKDLENDTFTRNYELEHNNKNQGFFYYIIGSDLIVGGKNQNSDIHIWFISLG